MLTFNVFNQLQPSIVVMSTPNRTFNKFFGHQDWQLRNSDHKYEFTIPEFKTFCDAIVQKYPKYQYQSEGLGVYYNDERKILERYHEEMRNTIISQVAVFTKKEEFVNSEQEEEECSVLDSYSPFFKVHYGETMNKPPVKMSFFKPKQTPQENYQDFANQSPEPEETFSEEENEEMQNCSEDQQEVICSSKQEQYQNQNEYQMYSSNYSTSEMQTTSEEDHDTHNWQTQGDTNSPFKKTYYQMTMQTVQEETETEDEEEKVVVKK